VVKVHKMKDQDRNQERLLGELGKLRQRVAELEALKDESKRTEEMRRENEAKFRRVFEQSSDAIVLTDEEGIITDWNPGAEKITGMARDEALGRSLWDVQFQMAPEERRTLETYEYIKRAALDALGEGQAPWMRKLSEQEIQRFDGTRRTLQSSEFVIRTDRGHGLGSIMRDVTGYKQAEMALLESEEKYRTLVEQSLQGLAIFGDDGIIFVNSVAAKMVGYTVEELMSLSDKDMRAMVHPDDQALVWGRLRDRLTGKPVPQRYEFRLNRRDGTVCWVEISSNRIEYRGSFVVQAALVDVTERKLAERALRRRNRELELLNRASQALNSTLDLDLVLVTVLEEVRRLMDATASSIWLTDPDTGEVVCRQATGPHNEIVRNWRLAPGEGIAGWVARRGESLIVPDAQADERHFSGVDREIGLSLRSMLSVPLQVRQSVIGALQVLDSEVDRFDTEDLALLELLAASAAVAIENARLYETLRDHAGRLEQRVQERTAELQAQYARLDATLRSTTDGIVVVDGAGNITQANPVARRWLDQTLSSGDVRRLQGMMRNLAQQAGAEAILGRTPKLMLELTGLDLELSAAPAMGEGAEASSVVVAIHDVTHLKALDRMKSRFVANVSHELRTPATTIKLYAHLMQQQPEKWKEHLASLAREADQQARLVDDILQISRIEAGRLEIALDPIPLDGLIEGVVTNHQALAEGKELTLEYRSVTNGEGEAGPVALIDPQWITQVLNNLVGNAIRYTLPGGTVVISTGEREAGGRRWATATVADTGIGIPEDELPHIFDRFFRGEKPWAMQLTGTGLGLSIVKDIVELHGGHVTVESEEDVGSTFTIWLPLAD
jgi:PAS domain S-box-containing protein